MDSYSWLTQSNFCRDLGQTLTSAAYELGSWPGAGSFLSYTQVRNKHGYGVGYVVAPGSVVLIRISRIFLQKYGIVSVVKPGSDHRVAPVSCIGKMLLGTEVPLIKWMLSMSILRIYKALWCTPKFFWLYSQKTFFLNVALWITKCWISPEIKNRFPQMRS